MTHELTGTKKQQQRWILTHSLEDIVAVPVCGGVFVEPRLFFISGFIICFVAETCLHALIHQYLVSLLSMYVHF